MNGTLTSLTQLLLSDRRFEVPIFQRGYAWEEENLRDLWDDLYYLDDREHYFGTILVKKAGRTTKAGLKTFEHFDVIDGQQRLTTTLILLRELIRQIEKFGNEGMKEQARKLKEDYVVYQGHAKLTIGGDDKSFFRESILVGSSADAPQTRTQKRLRNAQLFFRERFDRQRGQPEQDGHQYVDFLRDFKYKIDRLQVMLYIVPSNAEAVRMFETVNDRGRPLTNLEKTKSILMYAAYLAVDSFNLDELLSELNDHFSAIYRCFHDIEERLGLRDAGEIQRYHYIFFIATDARKHMRVLKNRLMEQSRKDKPNCERFVRSYARSLRQAFGAMSDIAKRRGDGTALGLAIDRLVLVERMGNLYPFLIVAWQKLGKDCQRAEILRLFEAFVFRVYRVVRRRSHTGQSWMNWLARRAHRDSATFTDFRRNLAELILHYGDDDAFRRALSGTHCYESLGTKTIKYLLARYEKKLRIDAGEPLPVDLAEILTSEYETEHILPQHPAGGLKEDEATAHNEIVHRLGNLTIASKEWNRRMGNRPFEEKKVDYRESVLRVQRELTKYERWNDSTIRERGERIVDFALKRWSIDPASGSGAKAAETSD